MFITYDMIDGWQTLLVFDKRRPAYETFCPYDDKVFLPSDCVWIVPGTWQERFE